MRRRYRCLIVTAGVAATVAAGGGLTAWAGWSSAGSSTATTARSGRVPTMEPPVAELSGGSLKIRWRPVRISAGVAVDRYVVIRIQGSARAEVCTTDGQSCRDTGATAGSTSTYVVRATQGAHWVGRDSTPSDPVVMPAPKAQTNAVSAPLGGETEAPHPPKKSASVPPDPDPTEEAMTMPAPEPSTSSPVVTNGAGTTPGPSSTVEQ